MSDSAVLTLEQAEKNAVLAALAAARGNVSHAAKMLACGRSTLHRLIKRYGLTVPRQRAA